MKRILQEKAKQIAQNPVAKKTIASMKPEKTIWGFLGIIFFFILPEVVAFFYGADITSYANAQLLQPNSTEMYYYYKLLVMMFEDGVSWLNLTVGFGLLVWLFF
ncbi:hypothetical protein [Sulfurimonas sp. HSL-1716]|uniref:hypothetical protein n=1 Tax=Hydrocurvibacter sulfurireducens TaxID=3131937 RepID=UPI0031FA12E4